MEMKFVDLEAGIFKIMLSGRLDIDGALKIDEAFQSAVEGKKHVVVDLSDVSFLASLGIRTLVVGAKRAVNNGGKLVVLTPQRNVEKVLRESNVDTIVPIIRDAQDIELVFGL